MDAAVTIAWCPCRFAPDLSLHIYLRSS